MQDFIVYYVLLVAIFIVCLRLRQTLKDNQNSLYLDNWKDLWLQALGILLFCSINFVAELLFIVSSLAGKTPVQQHKSTRLDDPVHFVQLQAP